MSVDSTNFNGRWGRVPLAAVADQRLGDRSVRVLAALAAFANSELRCWPSQAELAARLGVTRQAIGPHIAVLVKLGYITKKRRFRHLGGYGANLYTLNFNVAAVDIETALEFTTALGPASALIVNFARARSARSERQFTKELLRQIDGVRRLNSL